MIGVFDENPSTRVVGEGYSKAFQYLCDEAGGIDCYTITGSMGGGTGIEGDGKLAVPSGVTLTVTAIAMDGSGKKATVKIAIVAAE